MNKLRVISRNKLNGEYKTEMMFYDKKLKPPKIVGLAIKN